MLSVSRPQRFCERIDITKTRLFLTLLLCCLFGWTAAAQQFEHDTMDTSAGPVEITFIGHATLMLTFADQTIHIDPWASALTTLNLRVWLRLAPFPLRCKILKWSGHIGDFAPCVNGTMLCHTLEFLALTEH